MSADCDHAAAEHRATMRLTRATWVLCLVTLVLAVVTAMLAAATWEEKHRTEVATTQEVHRD